MLSSQYWACLWLIVWCSKFYNISEHYVVQGYMFYESLMETFHGLSHLYLLQSLWAEAEWLSIRTGALFRLLSCCKWSAIPPSLGWLEKKVALDFSETIQHGTSVTYQGVLSQTLCHLLFVKSSTWRTNTYILQSIYSSTFLQNHPKFKS